MPERRPAQLAHRHPIGAFADEREVVDDPVPVGQAPLGAHREPEELLRGRDRVVRGAADQGHAGPDGAGRDEEHRGGMKARWDHGRFAAAGRGGAPRRRSS